MTAGKVFLLIEHVQLFQHGSIIVKQDYVNVCYREGDLSRPVSLTQNLKIVFSTFLEIVVVS